MKKPRYGPPEGYKLERFGNPYVPDPDYKKPTPTEDKPTKKKVSKKKVSKK